MDDIYDIINFTPNIQQKEAIEHTEGPLLMIAGPGSGKTQSLILRTVNLIINKNVDPGDILVCTFTVKAAMQLKTRIANIIDKLGYQIDTSDIIINTIHGFCNEVLREYTDIHPKIDRGYEQLDEITQKFFINDNFDYIIKNSIDESRDNKYLSKWDYRWRTIENLIKYFNKLTQELINPEKLILSDKTFFNELGHAYRNYKKLLSKKNYVDFAFLQYYLLDLLENNETQEELQSRFKYIMVDEFQDTNYIQERLLYKLIEKTNNICVVGDEDQSLYRFRGATVRNLLEFPKHFPNCKRVNLNTNYRSHAQIIDVYNDFMKTINWGKNRFNKNIKPCKDNYLPFYNSTFKIDGSGQKMQAEKVANFIKELKTKNIINDYSEVVILIDTVKSKYSDHFIKALAEKGIKSNCPRARNFFSYDEIIFSLAIFLYIFNLKPSQVSLTKAWREYLENIQLELINLLEEDEYIELKRWLDKKRAYFETIINDKKTSNENVLDILYQAFKYEPFKSYLNTNSLSKYNLGIMSDLLSKFNKFYLSGTQVITFNNLDYISNNFFQNFFYVLHRTGLNEYEDREKILLKDHVSIMTIHQAKGLEFPVVIVSNLGKRTMQSGQLDKELKDFKHREPFENYSKINDYDYMRQYYVAFSRAENFLVLSKYRNNTNPKIRTTFNKLKNVEEINRDDWNNLNITPKDQFQLKKQFSLTSDILVYDTCPRQYDLYKESGFTASRKGGALFGSLIHETIEDINKFYMENPNDNLKEEIIKKWFEKNYNNLKEHMQQSLSPSIKNAAYNQIVNYHENNKSLIRKINKAELSINIERPEYFINGKIDIIVDDNGKYKLIDLKATKPEESKEKIEQYKMQLATYSNLVKEKHDIEIDEALIYYTGANKPDDSLINLKLDNLEYQKANKKFDEIAEKINNQEFNLIEVPSNKVCKECDFRFYCDQE